jgi:UPF0042 nucleotide-binding protein
MTDCDCAGVKPAAVAPRDARHGLVLVTGLSGAGKASILRALEDVGYVAVDNPPLTMLEALVARQIASSGAARLAVGIDARTAGFDQGELLDALRRLRQDPELRAELVYATAEEAVLLRRYTETRRRHPLAPLGRVADGVRAEIAATARLRSAADVVFDTSDLPLPALRRMIELHFAPPPPGRPHDALTVALVSFAYPSGLPREADLVFDARFLRNPHYDPMLRPRTGQDAEVAAFIEADPDFAAFLGQIEAMLALLLPRFVQEGKKYATVAIGCTGGRHRSVHIAETLAAHLAGVEGGCWRVSVTHRELARAQYQAAYSPGAPHHEAPRRDMPHHHSGRTPQTGARAATVGQEA